ncbi:MAG: hypothetical protein DVB31_13155 [Verrucomicrobia bacterium]|nr:MAG: hypothetical protein DVB31_13155 [Verrucomicrobiota bacterium]
MARFLILLALLVSRPLFGAEARIDKVLPQLLDAQGRVALSPSLYERDAYQAQLRLHPTNVAGLRFAIHWKAPRHGTNAVTVRLELRTAKRAGLPPLVLESNEVPARWGGRWTLLAIDGTAYRKEGDVVAWRAVIRDGDREVASTRSFLW